MKRKEVKLKKKFIYGLLFLMLLPLVSAIPYFSFVQQSPADISNTNLFTSILNITYNITDTIGLNTSTVNIYYKTNSSYSECEIYINGTASCDYQQRSFSSSSSNLYSFNLNGRDVYPGTYNYNETIMINTAHQSYLLNSNSSYLKIRLFNVTNKKSYGIFELFANASSTSGPLRIYYCNSSYAYGIPLTSPNCIDFYNLESNVAFNHSHSQNSYHQLIPFAVNTTNGKINNDIYVTPTSYFILRGRDDTDWKAYYIPQISRTDTIQNLSAGITTTLRPNAVGSTTNLQSTCTPTCTANWQAVDDITSDGDITRLHSPSTTVITYDLYNVPDLAVVPTTIKKVTVYMVVRATTQCGSLCQARTELRTNGVDHHGTTITLSGTTYTTYSTEYVNNPQTGQPWTISEINALQIGVGLKSRTDSNNWRARATQVYAIVEYTNWNNFIGTVDAHLHQYDNDAFHYYVCAKDTSNNNNCSETRSDLLNLAGLPPLAPEVTAPVAGYYSGDITLNYTESISPNEYPIIFYNISLVYPNTTFIQTIKSNNTINLSYVWNSIEAGDGSYRIEVKACDNQNQCSSGRSQIFTIDNTRPIISFVSPTEISGSTLNNRSNIQVNVTSTDSYFDRIRILLYNSSQEIIQVVSLFSSPAFWNFTNLADGTYYFNATALDLANNLNSTETRNITIDTSGPNVQFVSPTTPEGEYLQDWIYVNVTAADIPSGLKNITIYLYNSSNNLINSTTNTTSPLQINFTNLAYDTYYLNATAYDNLNNLNSTETRIIVLSLTPDTTPPATITDLSSNVINYTSINWQWTNPVDEDFYYAILYLNGVNIINTTYNYYNATELTCNTAYNLTIYTKDHAGNINTTYVTNINTTSSCPDYTPPAFVTGLNSNVVSETIISWRWTNPTDEDFNATILYLNGVNIADTANTFYNATGLTCDTLYNLTILTRDNNWNINTTGVTNINTTSVCPDITAPNIILESPIENHNISTNSINFNWTVTDNFDNSLSCNITLEGIVNISHVESINGTYTNYTISGFADGTYYWNVTCVDDSGNTNTSETRRFTIDTNKPTVNLNYPGQDYSTTQTLINFNWTVIDNIDSSLDCNLTIDSIVNISNVESVNGTYTNYTISGFADGTYYWNVTCVDDSGNTNTSETRRFTIDTTPPVVNLESPANNTLEQLTHTINFNYNTTDTTSNVENCSLYLNGTLYNTDYSITENTTQIFTESLNNGYYNWSISCIDSLGFTGNSSIRWLNISVAVPTITLVSPVNNYNSSSSNVTFNCSIVDDSGLINLTLYVWNNSDTYYINTTTITGTSNESSWMTESMPDGNYTWNCLAYDDSSLSDWGDENWTLIVNTVDSDGDGIPDLDDTLLGTVSNIQTTGVSNINVSINGSIANGSFAGKLDVVFWSGSNRLVSFLHNFSESNLNLSKVSMQLTSTYFIVNLGNQLQTGITKSMYLDDDSFSSFCVKDAEISSISEMSSACNGANETNFTICLGNNSGVQLNGLNCTDEGNRIRVDNLTYSAIRGTQASAGISSLGGGRSARYNMNLYVIKECTDKPITLIIKSLDNKSIFLAEVSIFKGNNTDINNRIIHHYLMRENALKFTDSLETTFNLTEQGYYTLLVRNTGYQDVKYGFDLKECVKEIKIELEPGETSLLDKKTEEKGKDIKSSLEKEKTVIKSKKITTISIIIIIITALFIYFLIHRSRNKENKVKEIF